MVVIIVPQLKKRHSKINKRGRYARASIPSEAMMHLPPVSDFPPIFDKFSDSVENVQNFTFSRQISRFSSAKISDDLFLVIDQNFEFPLFFLFQHISPCFAKIIISPTLTMMHLCITQCTYWTPLALCPIAQSRTLTL